MNNQDRALELVGHAIKVVKDEEYKLIADYGRMRDWKSELTIKHLRTVYGSLQAARDLITAVDAEFWEKEDDARKN